MSSRCCVSRLAPSGRPRSPPSSDPCPGSARPSQQPGCVVTDQRPNGVADYVRIDGTPTALAAVLAVLGLAVLGQFIVVSGRRRRRDFAILRTLGLTGRQVRVITAWQVSTVTGLALAVGIPLGVVPATGAGDCSPRASASPPTS